MTTAVERFNEPARRRFGAHARTRIREDELLRHSAYTRFLHWTVAGFFILALLSGFAIYSPWLFRLITPLFGGGPMTRMLHPWFSLGFVLFFALQFLNWLEHMTWTPDDSRWLRRLKEYVTNPEKPEPEYVGFFNAGQKLYFWSITVCAVVFMITGIAMWFPEIFGRWIVAISYVLHDLAAIVMLVGICAFIAEDSVAPLFAFSMPSSTPSTSLPSGLKPVTRGKTSPRDL